MQTNKYTPAVAINEIECPALLAELPAWLKWLYVQNKDEPKPRKVPYYTHGKARSGTQGGEDDLSQLTTFEEAQRVAFKQNYSGVGFAMNKDWGVVALDFDNCIDGGGIIHEEVVTLVSGTYAEVSPSGKGIRAFFKGYLKDRKSLGKEFKYGFEVFCEKGFVTFTGNRVKGAPFDLAPITPLVNDFYKKRIGAPAPSPVKQEAENLEGVDALDAMVSASPLGLTNEQIKQALVVLDPDMPRQDWLKVGMGLHHETSGSDEGFTHWDEWSWRGDKYSSSEELQKMWDGFSSSGGVTAKTILKMVKEVKGNVPPEIAKEDESIDQAISRLSSLSMLEYEKVRNTEAKRMGLRASALDTLVKAKRDEAKQTGSAMFPVVAPWGMEVDGGDLLNEITRTVNAYVICSIETARAVALWVIMTYLMDAINCAPLAIITAAEKACGKTKLLELIGKLAHRPLASGSISTAAMFRSIEAWEPTLLIDETDSFLVANEEIRGVINGGHTRNSAFVMRVEGENFEPKRFSTWCPKALSGISAKNLHDTITSRAIILELRRKLPSEHVKRLSHKTTFLDLCQKMTRWVEDSRDAIKEARPELPVQLNDRQQDNWEPLLAIADTASKEWGQIARETAIALSTAAETKSLKTELLESIQAVFEETGGDRIASAALVHELCQDSEGAWASYNQGRGITPRQVARLLDGYGIKSRTIRLDTHRTSMGYYLADFAEVWLRYLPVVENAEDMC